MIVVVEMEHRMDYYKLWKEEENKAFQGWNF
jgi:hypothetical protein